MTWGGGAFEVKKISFSVKYFQRNILLFKIAYYYTVIILYIQYSEVFLNYFLLVFRKTRIYCELLRLQIFHNSIVGYRGAQRVSLRFFSDLQ